MWCARRVGMVGVLLTEPEFTIDGNNILLSFMAFLVYIGITKSLFLFTKKRDEYRWFKQQSNSSKGVRWWKYLQEPEPGFTWRHCRASTDRCSCTSHAASGGLANRGASPCPSPVGHQVWLRAEATHLQAAPGAPKTGGRSRHFTTTGGKGPRAGPEAPSEVLLISQRSRSAACSWNAFRVCSLLS